MRRPLVTPGELGLVGLGLAALVVMSWIPVAAALMLVAGVSWVRRG